MILWIVFALIVFALGGLFYLSNRSQDAAAPGLTGGVLSACPSSPNCVRSEVGTEKKHAIAPLHLSAWEGIPAAVEAQGGVVMANNDNYIAAAYTSKLFRFVDDVEFRKGDTDVHVRSASRVGYGDGGVNRKRVEALRASLRN